MSALKRILTVMIIIFCIAGAVIMGYRVGLIYVDTEGIKSIGVKKVVGSEVQSE